MQLHCYADHDFESTTRDAIARYRYDVFVGQMGWQLPCEAGHEQDEFDTARAVHIVASDDASGRIIGYGRLLPTTQAYLLNTHFAGLVHGAPPPSSDTVWELSRYTAANFDRSLIDQDAAVGKRLLLGAIRYAAARGACSFVCCTSVAIERLARRWGVPIQRMGPPQRIDGHLLIAAHIEFTEQTYEALGGLSPVKVPPQRTPTWQAVPMQALRAANAAAVL